MNYLVILDAGAGELEKILGGIKSMLLKEFETSQYDQQPVRPGDSLYFLRSKDEHNLRVKATVVRVIPVVNALDEDLSRTLKEMQPRLQLTEDQFNYWSAKQQVLLVEFDDAHKIDLVYVAPYKITDGSDRIAFEEFNLIT
jgi:hypothetical protein